MSVMSVLQSWLNRTHCTFKKLFAQCKENFHHILRKRIHVLNVVFCVTAVPDEPPVIQAVKPSTTTSVLVQWQVR